MVKEITLTNGMVARVDDEDYPRLAAYRWRPAKGRKGAIYAARTMQVVGSDGRKRYVSREMQRDILDPEMKLPRSVKSDHRNHDTLDNRRENLRLLDDTASMINRRLQSNNAHGYRGVYLRRSGDYYAQVGHCGKRYASHGHDSPDSAAGAYNWLALQHHGEHARFNIDPNGLPLASLPPGSRKPNVGDINRQKTHCLRGHILSTDRKCRECARSRRADRKARNANHAG